MVIENKYENWKDIPWNKIKLEIYNLQYKIYCHAKKNNICHDSIHSTKKI